VGVGEVIAKPILFLYLDFGIPLPVYPKVARRCAVITKTIEWIKLKHSEAPGKKTPHKTLYTHL